MNKVPPHDTFRSSGSCGKDHQRIPPPSIGAFIGQALVAWAKDEDGERAVLTAKYAPTDDGGCLDLLSGEVEA